MSDQISTKENLFACLFASREVFEETIARLPEDMLEEPILRDQKSVKDMLGHIAFWQELTTAKLYTLRAGQTPDPITDFDAVNARVLNDFRHLSLEEVREREQVAYQHFTDMLESATEDELFKPDHFAWTNNNAFLFWIAISAWEHYDEHIKEVQAWLAEKSSK